MTSVALVAHRGERSGALPPIGRADTRKTESSRTLCCTCGVLDGAGGRRETSRGRGGGGGFGEEEGKGRAEPGLALALVLAGSWPPSSCEDA